MSTPAHPPVKRRESLRIRMSDARASAQRFGPLLLIPIVIGIWWLLVATNDIAPYVLPSPGSVARDCVNHWSELSAAALVTTKNALLGLVVSGALALPLAVAVSASWRLERMILPALLALNLIPVVIFAPIFVLWFGFGTLPRILTVVALCVFPLVTQVVDGLRATPETTLLLARSMGASRMQLIRKIRLPWALPHAFVGLKIAVTLALIGALVAEFVSSDAGIGQFLVAASSSFDTSLLMAAAAFISVVGILLFFAVDFFERIALPWHVSRRLESMESVR